MTSPGIGFQNSEIIIGLVGAVGTPLAHVKEVLEKRFIIFGYNINEIRISTDVIPLFAKTGSSGNAKEYDRIENMMGAGNNARLKSNNNSILALGAASKISSLRQQEGEQPVPNKKVAYIINSLKHPEEVHCLRRIYPNGFYLLGVHSDEARLQKTLMGENGMNEGQAKGLMARDTDEHLDYGQKVSETFHLSDFFIRLDGLADRENDSIWRILDLLFGHPYKTPTFDEYAMFLAFAASLRSADLSRQVGAVVARDNEILATGANDCPRSGGGLYWPKLNDASQSIVDDDLGRDFVRGEDCNKVEQKKIIDDILKNAKSAGISEELLDRYSKKAALGILPNSGA